MAINFPDSPSNGDTFTASGKSFVYNSTTTSWSAVTSGSAINLSSITSDILPDADSSRSLGSPTKKWKDLHLSGNTIFLGDSGSISASTGGEIILPSIKIGTGDNAVKLEADATGKLKTKSIVSGVTQAAEEPGNATIVSDMSGLVAITGMTAGQTALVTSLNRVFMYTGTGWFKIADMTNATPTDITGVNATYNLAKDGTATTITAVSSDPEGFPLTWSYAVTTGSLGSTATVSQADNVFTITPSTTEAHAGTFSITFSVTDGTTGAVNAVSAFTLAFLAEDVRLNISSTFPGPTYPNEVPANHAVSGQYLELTQTMSNNTRYGNIDFGPDNFEEIWVEVKGGNGGNSIDAAAYASGGSGSRIRASLDLTAIHTAYGHKKINFSVGKTGGARATSPGNGSGGGASAIWVWSNSDGTSGTAIPLIVAAGGGGGSSDGSLNNNVQGKDAFLPSSNMTTIQLFSHFSGFHSTIDVNSRPWLDQGPPSSGSGNGASWSEIGRGSTATGYANDVASIRDQFSLNNNPTATNANTVGANSPTFGGGNSGSYGGGGGGGYFGGFHGHYSPALGAMGGQSYIDTSYATLINHIVIALAPGIKIHKVNSSW